MTGHISNKKAQTVMELAYIEKQIKTESKHLKSLHPYYDKQVKKIQHLQKSIIFHDRSRMLWKKKQEEKLLELAEIDKQETGQ